MVSPLARVGIESGYADFDRWMALMLRAQSSRGWSRYERKAYFRLHRRVTGESLFRTQRAARKARR